MSVPRQPGASFGPDSQEFLDKLRVQGHGGFQDLAI